MRVDALILSLYGLIGLALLYRYRDAVNNWAAALTLQYGFIAL